MMTMKTFRPRALRAALVAAGLLAAAASPAATAADTAAPATTLTYNDADGRRLEPIVVTASGFEQKLTDAPASISVITREELQKRPYTTLIDAVRDLEGVDVGETADKTGQRSISIRGMGSDYTLVLIDGKRQNNHGDIYPNNFGGNQFNHVPPLDMIERIEVIRGPASTLYGADALGGVINIITRKVGDRWGGSISFGRSFQENDDFGDDITTDFAISGPLVKGTLGLGLRGSVYERLASSPEFAPIVDPNGKVHVISLGFGGGGRTVDNTSRNIGASLSWKPDARQAVVLDADFSEQEYDNTPRSDGSFPLGTVDSIDQLWQTNPRAGYAAEQEFTRDNLSLTHTGHWDFGNSFISIARVATANNGRTLPLTAAERLEHLALFDGTGPYEGLPEAERRALAEQVFLPRPKRTMESRQTTVDAKLDMPILDFYGNHTVVVGGQLIRGELEDGVFGLESAGGSGAVQEHNLFALFAEENWTPLDPLTITAGLRYDYHNAFGSNTSPRLYAVYTVSPSWTVKGGVSTGYKTPKTTDLYDGITGFGGQGTSPFVGNPDLQPETSVNSELAIYWTSASAGHNFNLTYFQNDFKDKIESGDSNRSCAETGGVRPCANLGDYLDLGYDEYSQKVNIDEAEIRGVEVAGRYQIIPALGFRANYTYTDSEITRGSRTGQPLTNSARNMANATLDWTVTPRLSLALSMEARSKRFRGLADDDSLLYYKTYDVMNLGGQFRINESITLNARINNLLDEDFTGYSVRFDDKNDDGEFDYISGRGAAATNEVIFTDDYNNKDKARNYWVSVNLRF